MADDGWETITDPSDVPTDIRKSLGVAGVRKALGVESTGQSGGAKPTESERNAAFLSTNLIGSLNQLSSALKTDPGAAAPSMLSQAAGVFGETAHNYATSSARQQVENAQLTILDSALTLGTGAAYTKEQLEGYRKSYFPQLGDSEASIADKKQRLATLVQAARVKAGNSAGDIDKALTAAGYAPATPDPAPEAKPKDKALPAPAAPGQTPPPPIDPNGEGDIGFNQPGGAPPSPLNDAQQAAYDAYMKANPKATADQIKAFGSSLGVNLANADQIVKDRDAGLGVASGSTAVYRAEAQHPGAVASAVDNFADTVTFGTLPKVGAALSAVTSKIQGDPTSFGDLYGAQLTANNATMANTQSEHFWPSLAGGAAGALVGEAGLIRAASKIPGTAALGGRIAARYGDVGSQLAGDAAYSTAYGAGSADDLADVPTHALGGAALGLGGAVAGRATGAALGGIVAPTGGNLAELYAAGVRPTLGQRFAGSGVVGSIVNGVEEGLQSLPGTGFAIRGARNRAREQFQTGAFNSALGEIDTALPDGVTSGNKAHAFMQKAFDDAYDSVRGRMTAVADQQFGTERQALESAVQNGGLTDDSARRFEKIVNDSVTRRQQNGVLSGGDFKSAVSELSAKSRAIRKNPQGDHELAEALDDYASILDGSARRNSPADAVEALDAADRGYAKAVRIEDAARLRGGEAGEFSPTQLDASIQKNSLGVRSREYLRGDALMQSYAKAGRSLVDKLPNSGTADRLLTGQALVGGTAGTVGVINPTTAALSGAVAIPYLPGVRRLSTGLLAPRSSQKARTLGDLIRNKGATVLQGAGVPVGLEYLPTGGGN